MRLVGVELGVADPALAAREYALLLGVDPVGGRFQLQRGAVTLVAGEPGPRAVCFAAEPDAPPWPAAPAAFHGLAVRVEPAAPPAAAPPGPVEAIDHVVVRTPDPERAIALWRDRLELRLAMDRAFPARGLRLLFFPSGGITLEFAAGHPPPPDPSGPDVLWGLSYRVPDLAAHRERLVRAGVDVTPVRPGHKRGTVVASVRSGTAGVPTLLLQETGGA